VPRSKDKWTNIRDQIAVNKAVQIINAVLSGEREVKGKPIKRNQEWMAWKVVDKMLPSLQAVSIEAQVNHIQTIQDVNAQLVLAGINPSDAWNLLDRVPLEHEPEKLLTEGRQVDPPHPPNEDSPDL
jgi:hypothetical protein